MKLSKMHTSTNLSQAPVDRQSTDLFIFCRNKPPPPPPLPPPSPPPPPALLLKKESWIDVCVCVHFLSFFFLPPPFPNPSLSSCLSPPSPPRQKSSIAACVHFLSLWVCVSVSLCSCSPFPTNKHAYLLHPTITPPTNMYTLLFF